MNPRQRRGAALMIIAGAGAVIVFIAIVGYVGSVRAQVGQMTDALRLSRPVRAYEPVDTPGLFTRVQIPVKWATKSMITDPSQLQGKVAAADLAEGSYADQGMVVQAPVLQPGQREIAILIDAETGVAGKLQPGMSVDIFATFTQQDQGGQKACAMRIISQAKVLQVGQAQQQKSNSGADVGQAVPITFALSTPDSLKLTYAESFATKVRLALIGSQGDPVRTPLDPVCQATAAK